MSYRCLYADIVGDLFHFGHVNFLRHAHSLCDRLVVGVHSDADVARYKRRPIMTMRERIAVVEACRYVDAVLPNAPLSPTVATLAEVGAERLVHGDDLSPELSDFFYADLKASDRLILVPYTGTIGTTLILERIARRMMDDTLQRLPDGAAAERRRGRERVA